MKIVCDACQAKYSISDDKVQGKVFKIRCKKCSNIIVVRGTAGAEPAPAPTQEKETRVYDYGYEGGDQAPAGDDAVWHVVINQDQVGPMTAAEVQQRFAGGEIDADSYIWREGFADWLPIAQVDTFAAYVQSGSTTAAVASSGSDAVASMFGGGGLGEEAGTVRSDPGDLFAAASSGARVSEDDGGDLFGRKPSATREPATSAAGSKLRGERNENSVLFSLGNLAQLASDRPAPSAPSASSGGGGGGGGGAGHATGAAGGEGSGLIDIRSMANAYLGGGGGGGGGGAAAKPVSAGIGSIDDLPVFGGGGFSEPAVMVPVAARSSNSKMMYALIGSVGVLAVAAIILVVVLVKGGGGDKKDDKTSEQLALSTETEKKDPAGDPAKSDTAEAADTKPDTTTDTAAKPDTTADAAATKQDPKPAAKPDTSPKPKNPPAARPDRPAVAAKPEPKPEKPKPEKPAAGGCDEVSCVISSYEGACCAKFKKGGSTRPATQVGEKPKSDVPESLDRTMISDGVNKVKARVMACGEKSSAKGQVKVSVKVNPDGSIASVTVKNTPDPGLGNCVAAAMQKATFKKTQSGGSFGFPFVF